VPDRNHFHHLLQNKGLSHAEVTVTLLTAQFVFAGLTFFLQGLSLNFIVALQFIIYFSSAFLLKKIIPVRKKLHIVRNEMQESEITDSKVYPIFQHKEKISVHEDS